MLIGPAEYERRHNRAEQAAEHPAERHGEIEFREMADGGPEAEELAVQRDSDGEQQHQAEGDREQGVARPAREDRPATDQDDERREHGDRIGELATLGEGDDEAQQIEAEWQHPEQRNRDDIGGEMRRRRQHQPRRNRRERDPVEDSPRGRRRLGLLGYRFDRLSRNGQRAGGDEQDEQRVDAGPQPALLAKAEQRLDDQRIGDEAGEAAEIGRGVERIGIAAAAFQRIPALHQRRLGGDDEEDRPDRGDQEPGHPEFGLACRRRQRAGQPDRQPQRGEAEKDDVDTHLPARPQPREPVRIAVTGQKQRLIDEHRAVPHRRRAAKPRQRHSRHHRLGEEQQEGTGDDRRHEQRPRMALAYARRRRRLRGVPGHAPSNRAAWAA